MPNLSGITEMVNFLFFMVFNYLDYGYIVSTLDGGA